VRIGDDRRWNAVTEDGSFFSSTDGQTYEKVSFRHRTRNWSLVDSGSGILACGIVDARVVVVNIDRVSTVEEFSVPAGAAKGLVTAFSSNGRFVATTDGSSVFRYDRDNPKWESVIRASRARSVAVDLTGEMAYGFEDGSVSWSQRFAGMPKTAFSRFPIVAVSINPACTVIAAMDVTGRVFTATRAVSATQWQTPGDPGPRKAAPAITAIGRHLAAHAVVGWSDGSVQSVELRSGTVGDVVPMFAHPMTESRTVIIGGQSTAVFRSRHRSVLIEPHSGKVIDVPANLLPNNDEVISRQGQLVSVLHHDESVVLMSLDHEKVVVLGRHPGCAVVCCRYVGRRAFAFSGGDDGVVRVWDLDIPSLATEIAVGEPIRQLVPDEVLLVRTDSEVLAFEYVS
jgi:WD40 repeat protein